MKCKNCETQFEGNFCNHCGQNAGVHRFHFSYFLKETFFSSLDIENGFFNTLKVLAIRPGKAIREYLEGKRVSLYVPGKFLLLIGAVATFIAIRYEVYLSEDVGGMYSSKSFLPNLEQFLMFAEEYTTVINVITVPVFAIVTYLVFRWLKYNFTEHLILNIYITAQQLAILVVAAPIILIWPNSKEEVILAYSIVTIAYNFWVYKAFFQLSGAKGILIVSVALILAYVSQFLINYGFYFYVISAL